VPAQYAEMKKYKYSIIYIIFLVVVNFFHFRVERFIAGTTGKNFVVYLIYGVFLAFFLVVIIKVAAAKKNMEIAVILMSIGLIFFFLFSQPVFLFQLTVLELFILGVLLAWEGKKTKSPVPFLLLAAAAVLVEVSSNLSIGSRYFSYFDAWRNILITLSGYLSGFIL
jgi:hypothetical protein